MEKEYYYIFIAVETSGGPLVISQTTKATRLDCFKIFNQFAQKINKDFPEIAFRFVAFAEKYKFRILTGVTEKNGDVIIFKNAAEESAHFASNRSTR